jgi:hypothetical protein
MNEYGSTITIEVVRGGFILTYPVDNDDGGMVSARELFNSPRKLNQKLKEVFDVLSTTPDDSKSD